MNVNYKLLVANGPTFEVSTQDLQNFDAIPVAEKQFHVLKDNKPYKAEIISADFISKKYTVKVNNNTYEVAISDALDELIKSMGIERGRTKVVNAIKAPMPGLILEINVSVGQEVKENDHLFIIEAMKMELPVYAADDGTVKAIICRAGQTVHSGEPLVYME